MGSRVNIYIYIFAFKFTLRCLQPDIVPIICHRYQQLGEMVENFGAGVIDNGGKFATGVVDTGGNFATGIVDTGGEPWLIFKF